MRERLSLGHFLSCVVTIVKNSSKDRDLEFVNYKYFAETPSVIPYLWISGCQWASRSMPVLEHDTINCKKYFVMSSKIRTPISDRLLAEHKRRKKKMFNKYKSWHAEMWKMRCSQSDNNEQLLDVPEAEIVQTFVRYPDYSKESCTSPT